LPHFVQFLPLGSTNIFDWIFFFTDFTSLLIEIVSNANLADTTREQFAQ